MQHVCIMLPVLDGKTQDARDFLAEFEKVDARKRDSSQLQSGMVKEIWYLVSLPAGDYLVVYGETEDLSAASQAFAESQEELDVWFKEQVAAVTGVDLGDPSSPGVIVPELLSFYSADSVTAQG